MTILWTTVTVLRQNITGCQNEANFVILLQEENMGRGAWIQEMEITESAFTDHS
jgi:hypothetical protein